jgi:hypothetical protein
MQSQNYITNTTVHTIAMLVMVNQPM